MCLFPRDLLGTALYRTDRPLGICSEDMCRWLFTPHRCKCAGGCLPPTDANVPVVVYPSQWVVPVPDRVGWTDRAIEGPCRTLKRKKVGKTMASFASSGTTCGARKHAWTKRKRERLNDGNNNGQATYGARKHAWRTQAAWAKKIKTSSGQVQLSCIKLGYMEHCQSQFELI